MREQFPMYFPLSFHAISMLAALAFTLLPAMAQAACLPPACIEFPTDAGFLNVKDFGAKGDGVTDDTAAINAALSASGPGDTGTTFWKDKIVYLPDGTYLVTNSIAKRYVDGKFGSGSLLMGQSRDKTIIKLADHTDGYTVATQPKAVIFTTSKILNADPTSGGKDYLNKGEGNDAYMNFIENLTVDVGAGNPGAIGIDYLANNLGAIRRVTVQAANDSGVVGIALTRKWPGPALIQDVLVKGFDIGIDVDNTEYGMTLDNVTLDRQWSLGLRNNHNVVSARNLTINNDFQAISNLAADGLIVVTGGLFTRTAAASGEAIRNEGYVNMRGVKVSGYSTVLGVPATTAFIQGVYNKNQRTGASTPAWAINPGETPSIPADPITNWANVVSFGAKPDSEEDSTDAIRRAMASGATTVYFPHGTYLIHDNIQIPSKVQRIVGMTSTIYPHPSRLPSFRRDWGMFRATNNIWPLTIEHLAFDMTNLGDQAGVEAAGIKPLVLRDVAALGATILTRAATTGGEVFIENACCGPVRIAGAKPVWAKQLNTEGGGTRIINDGSPLWILGLKTEGQCTILESNNNAKSEILGGLIYMVWRSGTADIPAFKSSNSKVSMTYAEESFGPNALYAVHLEDTKDSVVKNTLGASLPARNMGRITVKLEN